jgi:predicted lipoprotein with Yx(FWY)xxD motif
MKCAAGCSRDGHPRGLDGEDAGRTGGRGEPGSQVSDTAPLRHFCYPGKDRHSTRVKRCHRVPDILDSSDGRRTCSPSSGRLAVPLALVCALLAAACASSPRSPGAAGTTTTKAVHVPFAPPATTTTSAPLFYEVTTASVTGLGTILVNGEGFTLYVFAPDRQSGKSSCFGECENLWPPVVLVDGIKVPLAGSGVKASLLGTTMVATSGLEQITYNGWPLYLWHGDSKPGQVTGQGLNNAGGLWYVLNPNGVPVTASP